MEKTDKVFWIVSEGNNDGADGEFGDATPSENVKYRKINKREFGEVIRKL